MKDKGLLVLAIVGVAFAYFVFNFVGDVENEDIHKIESLNPSNAEERKKKEILEYYRQDVTGTPILDLSGVSIENAKRIWKESPTKKRIMQLFPNFHLMRDMIKLKLAPSEFRDLLLEKLSQIESDYLSGTISSYKAKEEIGNLK
jgi:hypothetical protein